MNDSQILSAFHPPADSAAAVSPPGAAPTLVFDACQVGVILRAVLFVEAVLAVVVMFSTASLRDWLASVSLLTAGALTATLVWLIAVCALKTRLAALARSRQYLAGMLLGAGAGLYGCGLLVLTGFVASAPWLASAVSGAMMAGMLVAALVLRAQGRTPAATTARLAELQARIRPHFLFNTLNSAIALVRAEPARAEALLEDLSDLFRHALAEQGESATLAQEIMLAQRYLAIEQVRFGERLQLEWALDPAANTARLPPLLLQPLVENSIRHGLEPKLDGGHIAIQAQRQGSQLVLTVSDTGLGCPAYPPPPATSGAGGFGLAQVRERLHTCYGDQSAMEIVAIPTGGTRVSVRFPIETERPA